MRQNTEEDVIALIAEWLRDPSWDIEDTEGFEDHRERLLKFRLGREAQQRRNDEAELAATASSAGCSGNIKLAKYLRDMARRLHALEEKASQ